MGAWTRRSLHRHALRAAALCALASAIAAAPGGSDPEGDPHATTGEVLAFSLHAAPIHSLNLLELSRIVAPSLLRVFEPYEEREVEFRAIPFTSGLDFVYGDDWRAQPELLLLFTCSDGYQPTLPVQRVLDHEAWLAFDRVGQASFSILKLESGSRKRIDLAPFYLIWDNLENAQLREEGDYGWPYQLVGVDLVRSRDRFPRSAPAEDAAPEVIAGYRAFGVHCNRCHAMNGEGGVIGPELNSPISPIEYRELDWLRRWIDDPAKIVPTSRMPRLNPALRNRGETIESLLAYLGAMSKRKLKPEKETPGAR